MQSVMAQHVPPISHPPLTHSFTPSDSDTGTTYIQNMSTFSTIWFFFFVIVKWMRVAMQSKNNRGKKSTEQRAKDEWEKNPRFFITYFYLNFLVLFVFSSLSRLGTGRSLVLFFYSLEKQQCNGCSPLQFRIKNLVSYDEELWCAPFQSFITIIIITIVINFANVS